MKRQADSRMDAGSLSWLGFGARTSQGKQCTEALWHSDGPRKGTQ